MEEIYLIKNAILIQIIYLLLLLIFILFILIFYINEKTFDVKIIILFMKVKNKLIYINGIGRSLVNLFEIIYLCHLYIIEKQIFVFEKTESTLMIEALDDNHTTFKNKLIQKNLS